MDVVAPSLSSAGQINSLTNSGAISSSDAILISSISDSPSPSKGDTTSLDFRELYKSLSLTAKQIVDAINEKIKVQLPEGVQSLKPEDVTPDKTAERIVTGVVGLYDIYAKQHKDLEGEELLNSFLDTVRGGIDKGYSDAVDILEGLGAFQFDGVRDGIEQTKVLIEDKLQRFADQKRKEMGILPPDDSSSSATASSSTPSPSEPATVVRVAA